MCSVKMFGAIGVRCKWTVSLFRRSLSRAAGTYRSRLQGRRGAWGRRRKQAHGLPRGDRLRGHRRADGRGDVVADLAVVGEGGRCRRRRGGDGTVAGVFAPATTREAVIDVAVAREERERMPPPRRRPRDGRGGLRLRGQVRADGCGGRLRWQGRQKEGMRRAQLRTRPREGRAGRGSLPPQTRGEEGGRGRRR